MSRYPDDELERLLRGALEDTARRVEPAGDGLVRIRERVAGRRHRFRWVAPALALAGAAAAVAGVLAAPPYLTGRDRVPGLADAGGRPVPLSEPASPTGDPAGVPSPSGTWGTPMIEDPTLPDRVAIWPYASRRTGLQRGDADVASGRYPHLRDAGQTAVDFVASFVGSDQGLSAVRLGPSGPGVQMKVLRTGVDGTEVPVSTVFLVRVRKGDDAPYVVLGASRQAMGDTLAIFPVPAASGPFAVNGNVRRSAGDADAVIRLALREPGGTEDVGTAAVTVAPTGDPVRTWTARIAPSRPLAGTGVVAAWTLDGRGRVVEFVAAPTGS